MNYTINYSAQPSQTYNRSANNKVVGQCSKCGGVVSTPVAWYGTSRPPISCEDCGAVKNESAGLPAIPMR